MAKKQGAVKVKRLFLGDVGAGHQVAEVTATAAELNLLASSGLSSTDLTKLAAVTASSDELNVVKNAWGGTFTTAFVDGEDGTGIVTITLKKADGITSVSGVHTGICYLCADSTGAALATITSFETSTVGVITPVDGDNVNFFRYITSTGGVFNGLLTADAGNYYLIMVNPFNKIVSSTILTITSA